MHARSLFLFALSVGSLLLRPSNLSAKEQLSTSQPSHGLIVENKGQVTDQFGNPRNDIDFRLVGKGVNLFVGSGHLHYQWSTAAGHSAELNTAVNMYRMDMVLEGANPNAEPITDNPASFFEQYYNSNEAGITAHSFRKVTYKNIYPNIDWVLYLKDGVPEYDFVIRPGGKAPDIVMSYSGTTSLRSDDSGNLIATTPAGYVKEHTPVAFLQDGKRVPAAFSVHDNRVRFNVARAEGTLTIDPVIDWGTYLGGTLYDNANQVAADDSGNVYVAGSSASTANIATTGSHQTTYGGGTGNANYLGEAFLAKFDATGQCLWATYYGGTGLDQGHGIAIDTAHNIYLSGFTNSAAGIATTGSYQSAIAGGYDAYLAKFTPGGTRLWGTYFGGTGNENSALVSISCDTFGYIYISGSTNSSSGIASTGAYQTAIAGSNDGFLAKFDNTGIPQWSTYFGGSSADVNFKVACAQDGSVYIGGQTPSTSNIASTGSYQSTYGGGANDAYIAKFDASGQRLWSTYFGGSVYDRLTSILPDNYGNIYIAGITNSPSSIATTGAYQTTHGGSDDLFLAKFNSSGNRIWSTYYGSTGAENIGGSGLAFDAMDRIYICGRTNSSSNIATTGSLQPTIGGSYDGLIAKFDTAGVQMWGSYFGGVDVDNISSISSKQKGYVFIGGETTSGTGIATSGTHQTSFGGGNGDAFVIKLIDCDTAAVPVSITGPLSVCKGQMYQYSTPVVSGISSYTWTFPTGWTATGNTNTIDVTAGGTSGNITVTANNMCTSSNPATLAVNVEVYATITPAGKQSFCAGDSILLTANSGAGFTYKWLKDGIELTGKTNSSYYATAAGNYAVVISNGNCADTSVANTVTVNPTPVPTISANGNDLITENYYVTYQWNYEGNAITAANGHVYNATLDGHYTVTVTDTNGCTGISAIFTKGFPDNINDVRSGQGIVIYPNPAMDHITIEGAKDCIAEIIALDGRVLYSGSAENSIAVKDYPSSVYILKILKNGLLIHVQKLNVQ